MNISHQDTKNTKVSRKNLKSLCVSVPPCEKYYFECLFCLLSGECGLLPCMGQLLVQPAPL